MIDGSALQLLLLAVIGWLDRREREAMAYLIEENRLLRRQIGAQRLRLTDDDRRRLAVRAYRLGREASRDVATIVTPDTRLRWHRQLVARRWTDANRRTSRRSTLAEIRQLVVRMAEEDPTWGYTRIPGALTNLGHQVGRSTVARIVKAHGLPPAPTRPTSWHTCVRAHWGAVAGADFFTTEVWTWHGLVTFYTVFVLDLATRRVQVLGTTPVSGRCAYATGRADPFDRGRWRVPRVDFAIGMRRGAWPCGNGSARRTARLRQARSVIKPSSPRLTDGT